MNTLTRDKKTKEDIARTVAVGVAGAAIGTVAAVVLSKKENRVKIGKLASDIHDSIEDGTSDLSAKLADNLDKVKSTIPEVSKQISKKTHK